MKYSVKMEKDTIDLGQKLASNFKGGEIVLLQGDLGAGKTVFTKGLAKGLGIKKNITSPTFVLFKVYPVKGHKKIKQLVHADCYRLAAGEDILAAGLADYLGREDMVVVVEWGERLKGSLNNNHIDVLFKMEDNKRVITI